MVDAKTHAEAIVCPVEDTGHAWGSIMKGQRDDKHRLGLSCCWLVSASFYWSNFSPALLIRTSSLFSLSRKFLQNSLTERRLARSRSMWKTSREWLLSLISLTAFSALIWSLQAMMTRAPLMARATAVSLPIPELPPKNKENCVYDVKKKVSVQWFASWKFMYLQLVKEY